MTVIQRSSYHDVETVVLVITSATMPGQGNSHFPPERHIAGLTLGDTVCKLTLAELETENTKMILSKKIRRVVRYINLKIVKRRLLLFASSLLWQHSKVEVKVQIRKGNMD